MGEHMPALGAMLVTQPEAHLIHYELSVRLTRAELRALDGYELHPWITVTASKLDDSVTLGAGITSKRIP